MARKKNSKQKRESKIKTQIKVQVLCEEFNEQRIAERIAHTDVAHLPANPSFEVLAQQSKAFRKYYYQIELEKQLSKMPGKKRDVVNCPLLRAGRFDGLPKNIRVELMEKFEPLLVAEDFVLF